MKSYNKYNNRGYRPRKKYKYPKNYQIEAEEVLVIDEDGEKKGIMNTKEAIDLAKSQDKDLVGIATKADPPVAKIIEWSKFKYNQEKKKKANKSKAPELKEMWFKAFIEEGDMDHKLRKVKEFIEDKHPVKLTIKRKGRVNREVTDGLMKKLIERTSEYANVTTRPKYQGPNYSVIIGAK